MPALSLRQKLLAPLVFCLLALLALTLFNAYQARSKAYEARQQALRDFVDSADSLIAAIAAEAKAGKLPEEDAKATADRKSTRLNSSHLVISYAVFCLKKKKNQQSRPSPITPR